MSRSERLPMMFLATVLTCAVLAAVGLVVTRVNVLMPNSAFLSPDAFEALSGLHRVFFSSFVLVPLFPCLFAAGAPTHPRLAFVGWFALTAGALLVLASLIAPGLDARWVYHIGDPVLGSQVSPLLLVGLMLSGVYGLCAARILRDTRSAPGTHHPGVVDTPVRLSAGLLMGISLLTIALTTAGVIEQTFHVGWFAQAVAGDVSRLAWFAAFTQTPTQAVIVLGALGTCAWVLDADACLSPVARQIASWQMWAIAVCAVVAIETRAVPGAWPVEQATAAWLGRTLFAAAVMASSLGLLSVSVGRRLLSPARLRAAGALLGLALFAVLDVLISAPAARALAGTYVDQARWFILAISAGLAALAGALDLLGAARPSWPPTVAIVGTLLVAGSAATVVWPMLLMGSYGLSMDMIRFPAEFVPLQTLILFGGVLGGVGMVMAIADLAVRAVVPERR